MKAASSARWCDPDFDGGLKDARETTDIPERQRLYARAQQILQQQAPWISIACGTRGRRSIETVLNFQSDPFGRHIAYPGASPATGSKS
jgi:dipeptide transport system substrate-binding protein